MKKINGILVEIKTKGATMIFKSKSEFKRWFTDVYCRTVNDDTWFFRELEVYKHPKKKGNKQ